jgi:hypothetical protein
MGPSATAFYIILVVVPFAILYNIQVFRGVKALQTKIWNAGGVVSP